MFGMLRKVICLVSLVLVLGLVGDVQADDVDWTDDGPDHLWSTPTNWASGTVPTSSDLAIINLVPGPIIDANVDAVADGILSGFGGSTGELTMDGGTLTFGWGHIGEDDGGYGTINMNSGTITVNGFTVGDWGVGTLNMTGGNFIVGDDFVIAGGSPTAIGHVNLDGGTIIAGWLGMRWDEDAVGTMDVRAGTLILTHDELAWVQECIDNGWITSYDGQGTLNLDYNVTNPGQTTLTAVHKLIPNPADGAIAKPGEVELSWTLPDPCVPGQPVAVDVYFTDDYDALWNFLDPESIRVVSQGNVTSTTVQTELKTRYYWAVDTYIGDPNDPILGPIFSFVADNAPPSAFAGPDISTFLQDGTRTGSVSGIVTDDGLIQPYTVTWSVVEQPSDADSALPGAVIADPTALQTTVTVSAEGTYVLQLEANDGEYTSSDTMTITVHPDDWTE